MANFSFTGIKQLWICLQETKSKNFEERCQAYLVFEFLFSILGYHKTGSSLVALNVAGISKALLIA